MSIFEAFKMGESTSPFSNFHSCLCGKLASVVNCFLSATSSPGLALTFTLGWALKLKVDGSKCYCLWAYLGKLVRGGD